MQRHVSILGVGLTLDGPPRMLEPIVFAYRRFVVEQAVPGSMRIAVEPEAGTLSWGERSAALVTGLDATLQLYQRFLTELMNHVAPEAVLHAAALRGDDGRATLLAAPSGHGKSSLTLELAHRGLGFLGDDYAPLDLGNGTVSPYPRAVGIVPDGRAPIPLAFLECARRTSAVRMMGKSLVDVGDAIGEDALVRGPIPLGHVFLLAARHPEPGERPESTTIEVASRPADAAQLQARFEATSGIEVAARETTDCLAHWRLSTTAADYPAEALSRILDDERVVYYEKRWGSKPDFAARPRVVPVKRREAAELLAREMLNRRSGGRLLAAFGGSVPALFLKLAGALREATCWRISVGDCGETADLIRERIQAG